MQEIELSFQFSSGRPEELEVLQVGHAPVGDDPCLVCAGLGRAARFHRESGHVSTWDCPQAPPRTFDVDVGRLPARGDELILIELSQLAGVLVGAGSAGGVDLVVVLLDQVEEAEVRRSISGPLSAFVRTLACSHTNAVPNGLHTERSARESVRNRVRSWLTMMTSRGPGAMVTHSPCVDAHRGVHQLVDLQWFGFFGHHGDFGDEDQGGGVGGDGRRALVQLDRGGDEQFISLGRHLFAEFAQCGADALHCDEVERHLPVHGLLVGALQAFHGPYRADHGCFRGCDLVVLWEVEVDAVDVLVRESGHLDRSVNQRRVVVQGGLRLVEILDDGGGRAAADGGDPVHTGAADDAAH